MQSHVHITADSTCDLPPELVERYGIGILPLYITLGDTAYKDKINIQPEELFVYVEQNGTLPKTAAVSVQDYIDRFSELREQGKEVVHINIGSGFSACHQNAVLAAKEVEGIYVVDSQNLSSGMGLLVLKAAQMAQEGKAAEEIVSAIESLVPKVETSFVLDSLEYLRMGGRCSSIAALGANLLSLKPCIELREGKMSVGKKYRGSLKRALKEYVQDRFDGRTDIDPSILMVTHAMPTHEMAQLMAEEAAKFIAFEQTSCSFAGCTISSHCGPGCLGVLFIRK